MASEPGARRGRGVSALGRVAPRLHAPRWTVAIIFAAAASAPPAVAGIPGERFAAGILSCIIGAGTSPGLGADRDIACTFERTGAAAERYEGLTGIVTAVRPGEQTVVFAVAMPRPGAPAALAGDYGGADFAAPGGAILVGGSEDGVTLTPVLGRAATDAAALNALLRLNQLHLNYAGRVAPATARGMR